MCHEKKNTDSQSQIQIWISTSLPETVSSSAYHGRRSEELSEFGYVQCPAHNRLSIKICFPLPTLLCHWLVRVGKESRIQQRKRERAIQHILSPPRFYGHPGFDPVALNLDWFFPPGRDNLTPCTIHNLLYCSRWICWFYLKVWPFREEPGD